MKNKIIFSLLLCGFSTAIFAAPNIGQKRSSNVKTLRAGCSPTTVAKDLDVNNVRARLMNGGDMWWDGVNSPRYEVPKTNTTPKKNSLFAGSIWIGGKDNSNGALKVAAQTYRQTGNDYWSGPLDANGAISRTECTVWDNMWKVEKFDILDFEAIIAEAPEGGLGQAILAKDDNIADAIKTWPAPGNPWATGAGNLPLNLLSNREYAPWVDIGRDSSGYIIKKPDGIYNYRHGDHPAILGDQYIWWVFNDVGNAKTETGSGGIGLEISAAAFAFATSDELNEATFYQYGVVNKATSKLDSTYFATWCDADLGYYRDDYVGCDVERSLGILYNGDDDDEGPSGYGKGLNIPMIGVDYFKGPVRRATPTSPGELLGMTGFTYFNNDATVRGNPTVGQHFYNYMKGFWKDGTPFVDNCTAYGAGNPTPFVFATPFREDDPCSNLPEDRRFIHSSGPLTLFPGAINEITIGALWVPGVGGNKPSFGKIQKADDKAQKLFDEGFKIPNGPMAPDMIIRPYNNKFVFQLNNPFISNNFNESYGVTDSAKKYKETSSAATKNLSADSLYKFEGYIVYQLKNASISLGNVRTSDGTIDPTKAKIVYQCDKVNGVKEIYNFELDTENFGKYRKPRLMVRGLDNGIKRNFEITTDAFSTASNKSLINYKTYYYMVVAYGYNNFKAYDPSQANSTQLEQYRESRVDGRQAPLRVYAVTPTPAQDNLYMYNGYSYGDGVEIKRIEGKGNGGFNLDLTQASEDEIVAQNSSNNPIYKAGKTPVDISIVTPDSVKPGLYTISLLVDSNYGDMAKFNARGAKGKYTNWKITREYNGITETIYSEKNIENYNEQILNKYGLNKNAPNPTTDWGFSVNMKQQDRPGDKQRINKNGYITSSIEFEDLSKPWLFGVEDASGASFNNWHRTGFGTVTSNAQVYNINMSPYSNRIPYQDNAITTFKSEAADSLEGFNNLVGGTWGAYSMVSAENSDISRMGLGYYRRTDDRIAPWLNHNHSVDVVFTNDRSKWTRCSVIEMNDGKASTTQNAAPFSEGNAFKYNLRRHASLEKDPDANGNPVYSTTDSGHSWFPGYAINIETGERLNILFGEDSGDPFNNGTDMIWNPTGTLRDDLNGLLRWGGRHVIYVSNTRYDAYPGGADYLGTNLKAAANNDNVGGSIYANPPTTYSPKQNVYHTMMWVSPALANPAALLKWKDGLVPTKTKVRLRVARPYTTYSNPGQTLVNNGWPVYQFNISDKVAAELDNSNNPNNDDNKKVLDRVLITPNPYFAQSGYETGRLDTRVKIINLPAVATINVYTLDGALVRTLNKSDPNSTFLDWDLRNSVNVPIASGLYLLHCKIKTAKGDIEKIIKFKAIMRPTDITNF